MKLMSNIQCCLSEARQNDKQCKHFRIKHKNSHDHLKFILRIATNIVFASQMFDLQVTEQELISFVKKLA